MSFTFISFQELSQQELPLPLEEVTLSLRVTDGEVQLRVHGGLPSEGVRPSRGEHFV